MDQRPGLTMSEYAELLGVDHHQVQTAMDWMLKKHEVRRDPPYVVRGRRGILRWYPVSLDERPQPAPVHDPKLDRHPLAQAWPMRTNSQPEA